MPQPLARYKELVPYQSQHADNGIPRVVMEHLAATRVYPIVSPEGLVGRNAMARLRGWPGLCLTVAECIPGDGPVAHDHTGTLETFYCVDGPFEILWGNQLEHKIVLQSGDLCSVPPNMYRSFKNISNQDARLLVLIQGDQNMSDKIEMPRYVGDNIRKEHGERVVELLAGINMRFQGGENAEFTPEQMQSRVARLDKISPKAGEGQAKHYAIMAPEAGAAAVACWPGLSVEAISGKAGEAAQSKLDADHCEWLTNVADGAWEIEINGEKTLLGQFDMIRADANATRVARAVGGGNHRLLVATHAKIPVRH